MRLFPACGESRSWCNGAMLSFDRSAMGSREILVARLLEKDMRSKFKNFTLRVGSTGDHCQFILAATMKGDLRVAKKT